MAKPSFTMQLTDTEKEIMDFVTEVVLQEYNCSKAGAVSLLFKNAAISYLGLDLDWYEISNEELLILLKHKKRETDKDTARMLGSERYSALITSFTEKYSDFDPSYMQGILNDLKKEEVELYEEDFKNQEE